MIISAMPKGTFSDSPHPEDARRTGNTRDRAAIRLKTVVTD